MTGIVGLDGDSAMTPCLGTLAIATYRSPKKWMPHRVYVIDQQDRRAQL